MKQDQAAKLRSRIKGVHGKYHAKTVAIVSGKGGVGKSNIALNFGLSLADRGKKVLLFDLDVGMGNIDILLGKSSNSTIIQMFERNLSIYDIIESGPKDLSYIAGGTANHEIFSLDKGKLDYFIEQLELLLREYDYIIFDMGAGVTKESIHFILAADECIVVTTPEPTSLTDAYSMVKHILSNQETSIYLILNRALKQKQGDETIFRFTEVVKRFLQYDIHPLGVVPDDQAVTKAVLNQNPFVLDNPKSKASEAIIKITNQFLGEMPQKQIGSRFLNKLMNFFAEG
ncbi:flagellar biosynthesis protein FlhG [Gracilibacillus ureilyticus]|uniref:Flagellar biosynthesis protein FlhG n=1 Tax=Gracilibacillus ureilyticus TaxID=531814 RepID=A0A1H9L6U2_9BACI|nr:MinD/ParA family protein [Gracilibacillus ureilyticus]SER06885.1 flagellar biosynthesis protein FlhG [Gracilibacillus ureilyticus]